MTSSRESAFTQAERKLVKRGIIVASVAYAAVAVAILTLATTSSDLSDDAGTSLSFYDIDGIGATAPQIPTHRPSTNALSSASATSESANEAYSAIVPFSEQNELFDNFQAATGDSGFAPSPQVGQRTARTGR